MSDIESSDESSNADAQASPNSDDIVVVLRSMMGGEEFDLAAPADVTVNAILLEVLESEECPFRRRDDANREIQYTLIWVEGNNRALRPSDTLGAVGVQPGNHLVLRQEARAGLVDGGAGADREAHKA